MINDRCMYVNRQRTTHVTMPPWISFDLPTGSYTYSSRQHVLTPQNSLFFSKRMISLDAMAIVNEAIFLNAIVHCRYRVESHDVHVIFSHRFHSVEISQYNQ